MEIKYLHKNIIYEDEANKRFALRLFLSTVSAKSSLFSPFTRCYKINNAWGGCHFSIFCLFFLLIKSFSVYAEFPHWR